MKEARSEHSILLEGKQISYTLIRKKVKNINVRIKPNGDIQVSANRQVPFSYIEEFLVQKGKIIVKTLEKYQGYREEAEKLRQQVREDDRTAEQKKQMLQDMCREIYPLFEPYGIAYPIVKIRRMSSRWGSCQPEKGIITLNSKLAEVPKSCAEYVIVHEFAHFIHPNHAKEFYRFVACFIPDYKQRKKGLEKYQSL